MKKDILKNLFPIYILIAFLSLSIGYASISSTSSEIKGTVYATAQEGVFITEVSYVSDNNANVEDCSNDYSSTLLHTNISLSETDATSSITYQVTIYNNSSDTYSFTEAIIDEEGNFYTNYEIVFTLDNIEQSQILESYTSITFNITFYYDNNVLSSNNTLEGYINFKFSKLYYITYVNISSTDLPSYVLEDNSLEVDLSSTASSVVGVYNDSEIITDYTYSDYILTVNNVETDVTIINPYYATYESDVINGYYLTLEDAYSSTTSSAYEIRVLQDVTDNSEITIESGKTVTLNTNNHTLTKTSYGIGNMGTLTVDGGGTIDFDSTTYTISMDGYNITMGIGFINMGLLTVSDLYSINYSDANIESAAYLLMSNCIVGNMYGYAYLSDFSSSINCSTSSNGYGFVNMVGNMYISNLNAEMNITQDWDKYYVLIENYAGTLEVTGGDYIVNGMDSSSIRAICIQNDYGSSSVTLNNINAEVYGGDNPVCVIVYDVNGTNSIDININGGKIYAEASGQAEGITFYVDDNTTSTLITATLKDIVSTGISTGATDGYGIKISAIAEKIDIISGTFTGTNYGAYITQEAATGIYLGNDEDAMTTEFPKFIGEVGLYTTKTVYMYDGIFLGTSTAYAGSGTINVLDGYELVTGTTSYGGISYKSAYLG